VKRVFERQHLLHRTTWFERQGRPIGAFVLHSANGEKVELPILFDEHLRGVLASRDGESQVIGWLARTSHQDRPAGRQDAQEIPPLHG
jgi:hypothetical protein